MGELSIWHWLVVLIVILLLFGSGKVSHLMGDFAKGIKAFRQNMQDDPEIRPSPAAAAQPPVLSAAAPEVVVTSAEKITSAEKVTAVEKVPAHHEG